MIRKFSLPILILCLMLASCTKSKYNEKIHTFKDATWHRFDTLSFEFPILKTAEEYNIHAVVRYTEEFPHNTIPVHFIMKFPSGEERIWEQTFRLRDTEGNLLGELRGGFYELIIPVRTHLRFRETGQCKITAEQFIPKYNTPGIVAFGLRLSIR